MGFLTDKIESAMRDDGSGFKPLHLLLYLISGAYAAGVKSREIFYRRQLLKTRKLPCRVVSIGNITVGGTGKTPMTIYVAQLARQLGFKTAVISRGYKGTAEKKGGVVSDGHRIRMPAETAGDEPYVMAESLRGIPVLVGRDRFASGLAAIREFAAEVLVLDDAFQHIRLQRDIDLVLLDAHRPFGNAHLFPRGPLREPPRALLRSDAVILSRCREEESPAFERLREMAAPRPVFRSSQTPFVARVIAAAEKTKATAGPPADAGRFRGLRGFAFAGLAENTHFRTSLMEMGWRLGGFTGFADHHPYTGQDLEGILQSARRSAAEVIITTEKDFSKISGRIEWPLDLVVIGVRTTFGEDEAAFNDFVRRRLMG